MNTPLPPSQRQQTRTSLRASKRLPWIIALLRASRRASSTNSSSPRTQRDAAIRLINQSTSGEIWPISLCTQVRTFSGASVKRSLGSIDCSDLKLPTQIISATSFQDPLFDARRLMSGARASRSEFPREENQRRPDQAGAAQQPEAIEKAKKCGLLMDHSRQLCFCVQRRVRGRKTVRDKISRQSGECFLVALLEGSGVSNQDRLVILRSPRKNGCNERDTNASSLVPEQIGQTRGFVVLGLWQEGIGQLAHRHKQWGNPKPLDRTGDGHMLVVSAQVNAGVAPHGNGKNNVSGENEWLDSNLRQDFHDQRSQSDDDEGTRTKNESCIGGAVAVEALEHLGNQHRRAEQSKAKEKIIKVRDGEVAIREQANLHDRVWMAPFPKRGRSQCHKRDRKEQNNEAAFEPVFGLSAIQNNLQTRKAEGHEGDPEAINAKPAAFPGRFDFARELGRVGNQPVRQDQRQNHDGNVDKENPATTPIVGDPPTERRADHRGSHDGHAVESKGRGSLLRRECVHENGLLHRSEATASDALQNAKENEPAQGGSQTAQQ